MSAPGTGCVQPAGGLIGPSSDDAAQPDNTPNQQEVPTMAARVGQLAPDFEATAYVQGEFKNIKLSDYKGKWVTLCFYPGDFTFV